MSETFKILHTKSGNPGRLLMRLTPSCGEYQNSRFHQHWTIVANRSTLDKPEFSSVPATSRPPRDCAPRSSRVMPADGACGKRAVGGGTKVGEQ